MESKEQRPFTTAGLVAIIGLVSLALFAVTACEFGASLASSLLAAFRLGCLMIAIGAVVSFKRGSYAIGAAVFALTGWPCVWPVLNSIAADGQDSYAGPLDFQPRSFINSDWLTWGLEVVIGIFFIHVCVRQRIRMSAD
jgi:hypothetical protein